ncbi:energy transducer TonB [Serratia plymuthica]|uniref:energy transducer TonB n=1 Tax=Serratia plymuthica TaxID=82996 RepID=UPI000936E768|nr:energy transducer TonB [Serratia plymuthica]OJT44439.1 energy transducer TonB [Serratia plymuthica]
MTRFILMPLATVILAGCTPMKPSGCEKTSAVGDCIYARGAENTTSKVIQPPNLGCDGQVFYERPFYPAAAMAKKIDGKITGTFDVDDRGKAKNIELTGNPEFYYEAKSAIARSCWKPGSLHEKVSFTFNVTGDATLGAGG